MEACWGQKLRCSGVGGQVALVVHGANEAQRRGTFQSNDANSMTFDASNDVVFIYHKCIQDIEHRDLSTL